jgi:hypothetical protein
MDIVVSQFSAVNWTTLNKTIIYAHVSALYFGGLLDSEDL